MSESSAAEARKLAMRSHARRNRRGQRALLRDRVLRVLVADLVAARTAAGMTQQEVAMRMWTTKSAVSRLERGRYARPTLDTVERYALAVGAKSRFACAKAGRAIAPQRGRWRRRMTGFEGTNRSAASGRLPSQSLDRRVAAIHLSAAQAAAGLARGQQASLPIRSLLIQIDAGAARPVRTRLLQILTYSPTDILTVRAANAPPAGA